MIARALIFLISLFCGLTYSTHLLVERVGMRAIPPADIFSLFGLKFAAPWLWAKWFFLYGDRFWGILQKTMWPIYASVMVGITIAWVSRLFTKSKKVSTAHGSSRWAYESELKKAGLFDEKGVVLGQTKNEKIIRHNGPEHILAIAPTRGGKGVGLVVPTLLEWPGSAVVFDPKGENWQVTSGYRETLGRCLRFDPTAQQTARFNPLMEIRKGELEVKDAQNIADIIVDPDGRLDTRNHWQNAAHSLLVGTILHVLYNYERKSLAGVVEFLTSSKKPFEEALEGMKQSHHEVVRSVAQEMINKHIEERSGVLSTAISLLAIFRDPLVAAATDEHDFKIEFLKNSDKPVSLYLVLPPSDISRLRVLIRLMLNQVGRVLTEKQEASPQRVLFLLDEFPALGRLEFFESALAYMAGYGLKAFLICQSLNQLQKAYGERNSILDNCHVRVAFANNDDQTAKRLSDLLGEQTLTKEQTSMSGGRFAMLMRNASISMVEYGRPLLLPSEINRLPQHQEIILVNGLYPILAHKLRYYDDKRFKNKVFASAVVVTKTKAIERPAINRIVPNVVQETAIGSAL
jgi:type IV secretion system protein VirD4